MALDNLKKCCYLPDWHDVAHERAAWRALMKEDTEELNLFMEERETRKTDEKKLRRKGGGL